jgi:hypothetical protein
MKEIVIGIFASMFFAVTFILNRSMELSGGSWIWSSSLRFFFMPESHNNIHGKRSISEGFYCVKDRLLFRSPTRPFA